MESGHNLLAPAAADAPEVLPRTRPPSSERFQTESGGIVAGGDGGADAAEESPLEGPL